MDAMSVEYAAPEQFDTEKFGKPDSYTDIYQVGAIIYQMITGCPPYTGGQAAIMHDVVYGDDPATPSSRRREAPTALDDIVLQALTPEKPQRYRGSIDRLEDALRDIRQGDATTTNPNETADTTTIADSHETRDWPMFQGGAKRQDHRASMTGVDEVTTERWKYGIEDNVTGSIIVIDDSAIFMSKNGRVHSLLIHNGYENWVYNTEGEIRLSSLAADNDTIYVGNSEGNVFGLNASDGSEKWVYTTGEEQQIATAVVDSGMVYVLGDRVYALESDTGAEKWTSQMDQELSALAIYDNTVIVAAGGQNPGFLKSIQRPTLKSLGTTYYGDIYALDANNGKKKWGYQSEYNFGPVAIKEGTVFTVQRNGRVISLDVNSGSVQWNFDTFDRIISAPAVENSTIYICDRSGKVYALDTNSGHQKWKNRDYNDFISSPKVVGETLYVGSESGIHALEKNQGEELWCYETDKLLSFVPMEDIMLVATIDDCVYSLEP